MVVLFVAQGMFSNSDFGIVASFCFTPLYVVILAKVVSELLSITLPIRVYIPVLGAGGLASFLLPLLEFNFAVASLPIALTSGFVLCHTTIVSFNKTRNQPISMTAKFLLCTIFVCGVHVFDFPFLRKNQDFAMTGFYIAFLLAVFMSVLLPYAIAEKTQKNYAANLKKEVELKTKKLKVLNQKIEITATERQNLIHLICHDLNNHLMVQLNFQGYLEKMHKEKPKNMITDDFELNLKRSRRVMEMQQSLTSKVNLMSCLQSGKINISIEAVNLRNSVMSSYDLLAEKMKEKAIRLKVNCPGELTVFADKSLIVNSVINNILYNAIKFSDRGSVIQVRSIVKGDEVWLVVKDYGLVIPQSQLSELFSRTKNTSRKGTSGEKGTGFGMPIVYSIMKKFEGDVRIKSREKTTVKQYAGTVVCMVFKNADAIDSQKIA